MQGIVVGVKQLNKFHATFLASTSTGCLITCRIRDFKTWLWLQTPASQVYDTACHMTSAGDQWSTICGTAKEEWNICKRNLRTSAGKGNSEKENVHFIYFIRLVGSTYLFICVYTILWFTFSCLIDLHNNIYPKNDCWNKPGNSIIK